MIWSDLAAIARWVEQTEPMVPLAAGLLSIAILLGCAVASWFAPSEKKDCIFHREVI